jgi:hypothetical protein
MNTTDLFCMNPVTFSLWSRHEYGIPRGVFFALVATIVEYRRSGLPLPECHVSRFVQEIEGIGINLSFKVLERKGLVRRVGMYGATGNQPLWVPTMLALQKFPAPPTVVKTEPAPTTTEERMAS